MNARPVEPPFDGSPPCPACPSDVRNMSAVCGNLVVNFDDETGRVPKKLQSVRDAVASWEGDAERYGPEFFALYKAAVDISKVTTWAELRAAMPALRAASAAFDSITEKHFESRAHSHGVL